MSFGLEGLEAVSNGEADFAPIDNSAAPGELIDALHPDLRVGFRLCAFGHGVAVRKGSDLLPVLNAYLAATKDSGKLQRIVASRV